MSRHRDGKSRLKGNKGGENREGVEYVVQKLTNRSESRRFK
jgi:hypothetical protein